MSVRCERRLLLLPPAAFLGAVAALLYVSTAQMDRPVALCRFPSDFTTSMADFAHQQCSDTRAVLFPQTSDPRPPPGASRLNTSEVHKPMRWAAGVPARLLYSTVVLLVPVLAAEVLDRVTEAASPADQPLTRAGSLVRASAFLVGRIIYLTCFGVALSDSQMDAPSEQGLIGFVFADPPAKVRCNVDYLMQGQGKRFSFQCLIQAPAQVALAKLLLLFLRSVLLSVVAWTVVNTMALLLLIVIPASRTAALGGKEPPREEQKAASEEKREA